MVYELATILSRGDELNHDDHKQFKLHAIMYAL